MEIGARFWFDGRIVIVADYFSGLCRIVNQYGVLLWEDVPVAVVKTWERIKH